MIIAPLWFCYLYVLQDRILVTVIHVKMVGSVHQLPTSCPLSASVLTNVQEISVKTVIVSDIHTGPIYRYRRIAL